MKLTDLEPRFVRYLDKGITDLDITIEDAQGIWFLCPLCFQNNKGNIGTHMIEISFEGRGVLPYQGSHNKERKPTRWNVSGSSFVDLTLTPSVMLEGGCNWHGFVTNGGVQ